jgi:superfamily I DNA/RNA helicase
MVNYVDGSLVTIAGPGSGKTHTLTEKIASIVERDNSLINKILLLTFTNSASNEIKSRVVSRLNIKSDYDQNIYFGTFHSIFRKLLIDFDSFTSVLDFNKTPSIITPNEMLRSVTNSTKDILLLNYDFLSSIAIENFPSNSIKLTNKIINKELISINTLLSELDRHINFINSDDITLISSSSSLFDFLKNKLIDSICSNIEHSSVIGETIKSEFNSGNIDLKLISTLLDDILSNLFSRKISESIITFSDILLLTLFVFEKDYQFKYAIQDKFRYVFVDEFQDTNKVQNSILLNILSEYNTMEVIGDPYQSIYSFLGANIDNIISAKENINAKSIQLVENYRSNDNIVQLTNYLASNMKLKIDEWKPCSSSNKDVKNNKIKIFKNTLDNIQRTSLINIINSIDTKKTIGILNRSGNDFLTEGILTKNGFAFKKLGGLQLKESIEIQSLINLISFCIDKTKLTSLSFFLSKIIGIGETASEKYISSLSSDNIKSSKKINDILFHLDEIYSYSDIEFLLSEIKKFYFEFIFPKISSTWKQDKIDRANQRLSVIFNYFSDANSKSDLSSLTDDFFLHDKLISNDSDERITVSTIHSSKGLEWDVVILMDWSENSFKRDDEDEAQRLNYVAISRAKETLVIFSERDIFNIPSSFINSNSSLFEIINDSSDSDSDIVYFGKYKGQPFDSMPMSYLSWLYDNQLELTWLKPSFVKRIEKKLKAKEKKFFY